MTNYVCMYVNNKLTAKSKIIKLGIFRSEKSDYFGYIFLKLILEEPLRFKHHMITDVIWPATGDNEQESI